MVFSSLLFLFLFLPAVLIVYYASPKRLKNVVLLMFSLLFYAWGEPVYILLMLFSATMDYGFGRLLGKEDWSAQARKALVAGSIAVNLALLSVFKYSDFLIGSVNDFIGTDFPLPDLPLPIGISFYTFQSMSYIVDVYRRRVKAQRNWLDFAAFVALFPQLVAGPIVAYVTVEKELTERKADWALFAEGVERFLIGLAKKVLLANNIGLLWHSVSAAPAESLPVLTAWLGIAAFAFQIYFDFSGYSDMAIGLGLMFGFRFNENFNKPYTARSITDFWRRWHMSLSGWFRDYVYIPLGGNRRGLPLQLRNILIVWMLTGLWHGASWNFLLWGLYFGVILMLEKVWLLRKLEQWPRIVGHLYAVALILVGWVLFAFESLSQIIGYLGAMAGIHGQPLADGQTGYLASGNAVLLLLLVLASLNWTRFKIRFASLAASARSAKLLPVIKLIMLALLFLLSTAYLVDATFNPFLYFRF
ncbi:MBOAT family O-acyltransferase [Paenibacillus humicus]|uniref:MBOAT family O-acyltransferase n=1 Tax=Paenibacillus humicus TaxID=412861 RepID=UPI000FDACB8D|nr:MBOAT family protein [Paenibacillus humicus]